MKPVINRHAFTMIELLFVIIILGIVGTLAIESLRQYYDGIYRAGEYSKRVAQADHILEQAAHYFENAIADSIIRLDKNNATFGSECDGVPDSDDTDDYTIAFVSIDEEGLQGYWDGTRWRPGWTGQVRNIGTLLNAPDSNFTALNQMGALASTSNPVAIFRSDGLSDGVDTCHRFGWAPSANTNDVYRTVQTGTTITDNNLTINGILSFDGQSRRAYMLRTGYAFRAKDGNFSMYSGFQPWNNEHYNSGQSSLLSDANVTHFTILYNNTNTSSNSNIGNIYTLKVCIAGMDENLSTTNSSENQICRERMVHVRY